MADKYKSTNYESKKSRDELKRKKSSSKKHMHTESRTPPLPFRCTTSIEDLIRKRESIKEELQTMDEYKVKVGDKPSEEKRKRKYEQDKQTSKKHKSENSTDSLRKPKDLSPEYNLDSAHLDSDEEEYIIEQRRKQRKQLLEQFNLAKAKKCDKDILQSTSKDSKKFIVQKTPEISQNIAKENKITDMFSEDDFLNSKTSNTQENNEKNTHLTDNWDDENGYFKIKIGEVMSKYTIKGMFGQGVFANVVKAQENQSKTDVAIKIIRNNDLTYATGLQEITILKEINKTDPDDKHHCVRLLSYFMHKKHLCLVLECLHMDLRSIIKKYGKNNGIHMKALMSYSRQLFLALRHLKKNGIIHADIKPDNILVNEKKNLLKLCDFGSAAKDNNNEPTPYLVSRFYRAPEIILGIPYTTSIDTWSAACTIYEMSTGKILFIGGSNNKMIKCFMDLKGKIPNRLLRKGKFKDQHFNYNYNFLLHKKDEFTGREKVVEVININIFRDLQKELLKSFKHPSPGEVKKIGQLRDLLDKMLMLDPSQRLSVTDCLKHVFIQESLQK